MSTPSSGPGPAKPDAMTAMLLQVSQQGERLGLLDQRETGHFEDVSQALARLRATVSGMNVTVGATSHILQDLDGITETVGELQEQVRSLLPPEAPEGRYWPVPTPAWWDLQGEEREDAIARLRGWVADIYRPMYGKLANGLGRCWELHPFCLITLDWVSEFWNLLYLTSDRIPGAVSAQGDFSTRILPPAAAAMTAETTGCQHPEVIRIPGGA